MGSLGRVLVLGLGKSGKSAARYLAGLIGSRVEGLFIAAGAETQESRAFLEGLRAPGVEWAFGDGALDDVRGAFDLCIASPGIPYWHDLYQRALEVSAELVSEVEFAWRESDPSSRWVAITGTNGKTTTTAMCAHVLKECGFKARAVGNIGDVCLDAVAAGGTEVYVAEVSSYQLYSTHAFSPDVAVELNITPDHVHWHKTLEAYRDAKFSMLDHLGKGDARRQGAAPALSPARAIAVLDATNDVVRAKVRELRQVPDGQRGFDYIPMGTADGIAGDMRARCGSDNAAFIDDGMLVVALDGVEHRVARTSDLLVKGAHNASNALAAACVGVALGAPDSGIAQALSTFAPIEHRIEPCGSIGGVACYNDSKATNVDAVVKALESFPGQSVVVLLGGQDKGTDLGQLVQAVFAHAAGAVCFGEGGPRIHGALAQAPARPDGFGLELVDHMEGALDAALGLARPGDAVLLSPACASFDEFGSFEERGRAFKRLVSQRMEG